MATGDLVTLAAMKSWLNITTTNDDTLLSTLITQISRAIYNYTNRTFFLPRTVTETYDGMGRQRLLLRNWPVVNVLAVSVDGNAIPASPIWGPGVSFTAGYCLEPADDDPPGAMQAIDLRGGYCFHKGRQNVVVTYLAGYIVQGEAQTVPSTPTGGLYQLTYATPYGTWGLDQGVTYANGTALTLVTGTPTTGQYNVANGVYTFAVGDASASLLLSYGYIPSDLEQCALEWIADRYKQRDHIGQSSKSLGGQETVAYLNQNMPMFVKETLRALCRIIAN
jgi:hypothetical protein